MQGPPFVQGTRLGVHLTPQPSGMSCFSATMSSNSAALNSAKPLFLEMWVFWWPGNLNLALCRAKSHAPCSAACADGYDDLTSVPWVFQRHSPVSPSAGHLVDADDVGGVEPHSEVKAIFATAFHHVLVGTKTGAMFIGRHVATEWELLHSCLLPHQVNEVDVGIRDTSAEARPWVWLLVLRTPVTLARLAAHGDIRIFSGTPKGKRFICL